MANKALQHRMMDYLGQKLSDGGHKVVPKTRDLLAHLNPAWAGVESHYLLLDNETPQQGLVFLIDKPYTEKRFKPLVRDMTRFGTLALVFLKDGTTYFRNAATDNDFKRKHDLSLKNYTSDQTHRMILFRPEERIAYGRSIMRPPRLQYYQPASDRLEEALVTYAFGRVQFDYSHITSDRYHPTDTESERIFIWKKQETHEGSLTLSNGLLLPQPAQEPVARSG